MAWEPIPPSAPMDPDDLDATLPYDVSRRRALAEFERRYVVALLRLHEGRVVRAAAAAGMDRRYLHRLMQRHGVRRT